MWGNWDREKYSELVTQRKGNFLAFLSYEKKCMRSLDVMLCYVTYLFSSSIITIPCYISFKYNDTTVLYISTHHVSC